MQRVTAILWPSPETEKSGYPALSRYQRGLPEILFDTPTKNDKVTRTIIVKCFIDRKSTDGRSKTLDNGAVDTGV